MSKEMEENIIALKQRAEEMLKDDYSRKIGDEEIYTIICEWERIFDLYNKDYISKDKIREKIKKLENEFNFYAGRDLYEWDDSEFDGDRCDTLGQQIKVLKELLEGEE